MEYLTNILTRDVVQIKKHVENWEEAVSLVARPLLDKGFINEKYVSECKQVAKEVGAYFVVCPGVALSHARPSENVKKISLSILTLDKPIEFGHPDNDPVGLVFMFAAVDNYSHMELLSNIAKLLSDETLIQKVINADKYEEIISYFEESQVN